MLAWARAVTVGRSHGASRARQVAAPTEVANASWPRARQAADHVRLAAGRQRDDRAAAAGAGQLGAERAGAARGVDQLVERAGRQAEAGQDLVRACR